jgi:threonine/homoserine/homoserine lactone efflux protein
MIAGPQLVMRGMLLGIGAAAPIGPVNVEIARRTFRAGFWAGFALGCGAVTVDIAYAVLSSLSLQAVLNRPAVLWPIQIAGIGFLLYLGMLSFRSAARVWNGGDEAPKSDSGPRHGTAYLTGLAMTLLNPMTLAFWFLAVPAAIGAIAKAPGHDLPVICIGVFIGTIAWVIGFAGAMAPIRMAGRRRRAGRHGSFLFRHRPSLACGAANLIIRPGSSGAAKGEAPA